MWPAPWVGQGQSTAPHPAPIQGGGPTGCVTIWGRPKGPKDPLLAGTPSFSSWRKQGRQEREAAGPVWAGHPHPRVCVSHPDQRVTHSCWHRGEVTPQTQVSEQPLLLQGVDKRGDSDMRSQPGWKGASGEERAARAGPAAVMRTHFLCVVRRHRAAYKPQISLLQHPTAEDDAAPCAQQLTDGVPPKENYQAPCRGAPSLPGRGPGPVCTAQSGQRRARQGLARRAGVPSHTTWPTPFPKTLPPPRAHGYKQPRGSCIQRPAGAHGTFCGTARCPVGSASC